MTAAYDAARQQLGIGENDPRTATLATTIIELARTGAWEPAALCEKAVAAFQEPTANSRPKGILKRVSNVASVPPMSPNTRS